LILPDGKYYYKITASDDVGNTSVIEGEEYSIILDNTKPVINLLRVEPEIISPNNDGIVDKTEVSYFLSDNLSSYIPKVDIVVKDIHNNIIKVIYDNVSQDLGNTYSIEWDGALTSDGIYYVSINCIDLAGNSAIEKKAEIKVDLTPPVTTFMIGEPKYDYKDGSPLLVSSKTPIILTATDPLVNGVSSGVKISQYCIKKILDLTPIQEIDWVDYTGGAFYLTGEDGDYKIYYRSIDNVGNIEKEGQDLRKIILRVDNTPPEADIISPPSYCWVNGNINIIGTANDIHFDWYKIEYESEMGTGVIKYETSEQKENDVLGIWQTLGLVEGWYRITLTAQDKVENISTIYIDLIVGEPKFILSFGGLGEMNKPMYIAQDSLGNLYVTDENNKRVKKYTSDGQFICNIIEEIMQPQGIAVDFEGNIYVAGHHSLYKYNSSGEKIWEKTGLNQPMGIKFSPDGYLWIADRNNNRIIKYTKEGNEILQINSFIAEGKQHNFNKPSDIDFDNNGNIYVIDSENNRVVIINQLSFEGSYFGECCVEATYFNKPEGISITYPMNELSDFPIIYISDRNNDLIKCFDKFGNPLGEFGGNGNSDGKFNKPEGLLVTFKGTSSSYFPYIYIVDRNNNRVQKFGMPEYEKMEQTPILSQVQSKIEIKNHISYPNPFSPNGDGINDYAKIRFELTEEAEVQVKIYNQIGKLVYVYEKIYCNAGANEVLWEGVNNLGKRINNGIYIYYIKAKSSSGKVSTASGKIVVIK
jgi:gliding motility-associated-like protein